MPMIDELGNSCSHVVRLHLRSLGIPRVTEFTAMRNAQAVYGPHGICMFFASGMSMLPVTNTDLQCVSLAKVDVGTCTMQQPMTLQQSAMFGIG